MKEEIWKDIEGYEGKYQVSSLGNVRSLNYKHTGKEKLLKPGNDKDGYLTVCLYKIGKMKLCKVHRLVAKAFIPNPDNLPCINHKDECKTNNMWLNLEWCSHKYNVHYSHNWEKSKEVTRKPVLQFTKDGVFVKEYESTREAERKTGIRQTHISRCCLCRKGFKSAGNYIWKFK